MLEISTCKRLCQLLFLQLAIDKRLFYDYRVLLTPFIVSLSRDIEIFFKSN